MEVEQWGLAEASTGHAGTTARCFLFLVGHITYDIQDRDTSGKKRILGTQKVGCQPQEGPS